MQPQIVERRYSHRRPRKRPSWLRVVFYATSLLPAIWVAWQLNKLHERLGQGAAAPQVIHVPPPPSPPRTIQNQPRLRIRPPSPQPEPQLEPVKSDQVALPSPTPPAPAVLPRLAPSEVIDLNLSARRQRVPLAKAEFIVLGLKGCKAPHKISPSSGKLTRQQGVTIRVDGPREILLRLSLTTGDNASVLTIEPAVITADDEEIPFYLAAVERIQARIRKEGTRATAQLDAMMSEREHLQTWINAPVAKPLAARGRARTRVAELNNLIPPTQREVQSLEQDRNTAEAMEKIAQQLDEDCQIELAAPQKPEA